MHKLQKSNEIQTLLNVEYKLEYRMQNVHKMKHVQCKITKLNFADI